GLPGVLADALPDAFGNRVIRAYFAARGESERAMSPVQRLLYVGDRALGALTFHPEEKIPIRPAELESLEIQSLVRDARRIIAGAAEVAVPEIYRIGASAGGMRPKALVNFAADRKHIRSGYAPLQEGEVRCILKFDGVGEGSREEGLGRTQPFHRIEAAYMDMARAAGIETAEVDLLETEGYAHLLVQRFDMSGELRMHQHTLGGLLHVDYNDPGASSYEEFFRAVLRLGMPYASVAEAYRRAIFNLVAVNQDDHVKNQSFHMGADGDWRLTPAYDITFAKGEGYTARHQMRVRDKMAGVTRRDLLNLGEEFGINDPRGELEAACDAVAQWEAFADGRGVPGDERKRIRADLDQRQDELG
ncbi:MAG: type II toxin-antitoxin system HipA family toxin, partial [Planctomycetota bacterium]